MAGLCLKNVDEVGVRTQTSCEGGHCSTALAYFQPLPLPTPRQSLAFIGAGAALLLTATHLHTPELLLC